MISSEHHEVESISRSIFDFKMRLTIKKITKQDLGSYKCIAKNSLGEVESSIRLYGKFKNLIITGNKVRKINHYFYYLHLLIEGNLKRGFHR